MTFAIIINSVLTNGVIAYATMNNDNPDIPLSEAVVSTTTNQTTTDVITQDEHIDLDTSKALDLIRERMKSELGDDYHAEKPRPEAPTYEEQLVSSLNNWIVGEVLTDEEETLVDKMVSSNTLDGFSFEEKKLISEQWGIGQTTLESMIKNGLSTEEMMNAAKFVKETYITENDIVSNSDAFKNYFFIEGQMQSYYYTVNEAARTDEVNTSIKQGILDGATFEQSAVAYIMQQELGADFDTIINSRSVLVMETPTLTEEEKASIYEEEFNKWQLAEENGESALQSELAVNPIESTIAIGLEGLEIQNTQRTQNNKTMEELATELANTETAFELFGSPISPLSSSSANLTSPGEIQYSDAPFTYDYTEHAEVSVLTGNLTLDYTDLSLPGANGLDLNISRHYNASKSNEEIPVPDIFTTGRRTVYYTGGRDNTQIKNLYWLGYGWQLDIPFVESIRGDYEIRVDRYDYYETFKYLNLGSEGSYEIDITSTSGDSNLMGYELNDLRYENHSGTLSHPSGNISYSSVLYRSNGTNTYFDSTGRTVAIKDKYNNIIRYSYTSNQIRIEDTVGRIITYTKQTVSGGHNVVLQVQEGSSIKTYTTYKIRNDQLIGIVDAFGGETVFEYYVQEMYHNYFYPYNKDFLMEGGYYGAMPPDYFGIDINYHLLEVIYYPNGGYSVYHTDSDKMYYGVAHQYNYNDGRHRVGDVPGSTETDYGIKEYPYTETWYEGTLDEYGDYLDDYTLMKYKFGDTTSAENRYRWGDNYTGYPTTYGYVNAFKTAAIDDFDNETIYQFPISFPAWQDEPQRGYYPSSANIHMEDPDRIYHPGSQELRGKITFLYSTAAKIPSGQKNIIYEDGGAITLSSEIVEYNNYKNPTRITYPSGKVETMTYDSSYQMLTQRTTTADSSVATTEKFTLTPDKKSVARSEVYDGSLNTANLSSVFDYTYNSRGMKLSERSYYGDNLYDTSESTYTTYEYGDSGWGSKFAGAFVTAENHHNVKNPDGALVTTNGENVITVNYKYDWYGRKIEESHPEDQSVKKYWSYDIWGRVLRETDFEGNTIINQYNNRDNTLRTTDQEGNTMLYDYDGLGYIKQVYDVTGGNTLVYDYYDYEYDGLIKRARALDENGVLADYYYQYDYRRRPTAVTVRDGSSNGPIISQTLYEYDVASNANGIGETTLKTTTTVVGDSNSPSMITTNYHDKANNLVLEGYFIDGSEKFDQHKYNGLGEKIQTLTSLDKSKGEVFTTKWEYDYNGNLVKETNADDKSMVFTYDGINRKTEFTDALGNTITYEYDNLGRLISEKIPFEENNGTIDFTEKEYYYDTVGNIISSRMTNNAPEEAISWKITDYSYDYLSRPVLMTVYDGDNVDNHTAYRYDGLGNITDMYTGMTSESISTAQTHSEFTYDHKGNQTSRTDGNGLTEYMTYDINGLLTRSIDRNGNTTNYTYDSIGRMLSSSVNANGVNSYVNIGYTLTGKTLYEENNNFRVVYKYDELGRLVEEKETGNVVKTYDYDVEGNRTKLIVKNGSATLQNLTYTYDNLNRLQSVKDGNVLIGEYDYDSNGNRTLLTYDNGTKAQYTYNLANAIVNIDNLDGNNVISSYSYDYYLDGNQSKKTNNNGAVTEYVYDNAGRLLSEHELGKNNIEYTYDANSNRITMSVSGIDNYITTYDYDDGNRLLSTEKSSTGIMETTNYTYDDNGNMLSTSVTTLEDASTGGNGGITNSGNTFELYTYNGYNQQISILSNGIQTNYNYMPDGLRYSKSTPGVLTTTHIWDGNNIVADIGSNGTSTSYIRGINLLASRDNTLDTQYYIFNAHGDVVQLTSTSGQVVWEYDYDAFGNQKEIVGYDSSSDNNPFRYAGEYFDRESGNIYLRARYYDPVIGRFTSEDTVFSVSMQLSNGIELEDPLSLNRYTYTHNNPIIYVDATGNAVVAILVSAGIGGILGAIEANQSGGNPWIGGLKGALFGGATAGIGSWIGIWKNVGVIGKMLASGVGNGVFNAIDQWIESKLYNKSFSWSEFATSAITGMASMGIGSSFSKFLPKEKVSLGKLEENLMEGLYAAYDNAVTIGLSNPVQHVTDKHMSNAHNEMLSHAQSAQNSLDQFYKNYAQYIVDTRY